MLAFCTGIYNAETDVYIDHIISAECKARDKRKLIVDYSQLQTDKHLSTFESYLGATQLPERGLAALLQIAYIDREEYRPNNDMFRLVARNRGINLCHFYTLEEALAWMRGAAQQ